MTRILLFVLFVTVMTAVSGSFLWMTYWQPDDVFYLPPHKKNLVVQEEETPIHILAVGDTMLGRSVGVAYESGTDLFAQFRSSKKELIDAVDIFIANLEGPITETSKCQNKEIVFSFNPSVASMLAENGITHVSLANNHSFDCFEHGLVDTKRYLDEAGIVYAGGGALRESATTTIVRGKRIAIMGIDRTIAPPKKELVFEHVQNLTRNHEYVVVEVHWGNEYELIESDDQRTLAHGLIDAGADVIIGHHPHVVQPIEFYNGKPIFYSLGNFIFDQIGKERNTGIAVELLLGEKEIKTIIHPYTISRERQPTPMPGNEALLYCASLISSIPSLEGNACTFSAILP